MNRHARALAALVWGAGLVGCDACAPEAVAELRGHTGHVERDFAADVERWSDAELGARFRIGDGLRTSVDSHAMLELMPAGSAYVAPSTVVRFSADAPGEPAQHIVLEAGSIELSSDRFEIVVHTPRALARLSRKAKAKLSAGDERGGSISVALGSASLLRTGETSPIALREGETRPLAPWFDAPAEGAPLTLAGAASEAMLAPLSALPGDPSAVDDDAGLPEVSATPPPGTARSTPRAAKGAPPPRSADESRSEADVRVSLSEHAVVHADALPVRAELLLPSCADGSGELSVGGRQLASSAQATLELGAGRHGWSFRCAGRVLGEGALRVQRDEARRPLTESPADVPVATDGRRYRVRHGGTIPNLAVRWPGAPGRGPYLLRITSGGRARELELEAPSTLLSGAELGGASVELLFRQREGASAPVTTVELSADDHAELLAWEASSPAARAGRVTVRGHVLPGSRLRLAGARVEAGPDGAFTAQVSVPRGARALVAEVTHPLLGRHYYVRQLH